MSTDIEVLADASDKPWLRQSDESSKAYAAFSCFRDLGPSRTIEEAWRKYKAQQGLSTKRPNAHFHKWKDAHEWQSRSIAFDNMLSGDLIERRRKAIEEATEVLLEAAVPTAKRLASMAVGGYIDEEKYQRLVDEGSWPEDALVESWVKVDADKAVLMACRDLLDRVGVTRKRAEATKMEQTLNQQTNEYNFDFSNRETHEIVTIVRALKN